MNVILSNLNVQNAEVRPTDAIIHLTSSAEKSLFRSEVPYGLKRIRVL